MIDIASDQILDYLNRLFEKLGKPVKMLAWPLGVKGTERKWETIMRREEIRQAVARGGNIGIVLGENLVTIDIDDNEEMGAFFKFAPWAKDTLISVGKNGCQCWFIIEGEYPHARSAWKTVAGKPTIEFRADGAQSIIWGDHPDKDGKVDGRYTTNGKQPQRISYYDLEEYRIFLQQRTNVDEEVDNPESKDDYEWARTKYKNCAFNDLDLIELLKDRTKIKYRKVEDSVKGRETYCFPCPWKNEHSTDDAERDAAVFMFTPIGRRWPQFKCFHAHCDERRLKDLLGWLDLEHGVGPSILRKYCKVKRSSSRLVIVDYTDLVVAPPLPPPIIEGLLYPELKMLIASAAKIGKTWMGLDLAICLAAGFPWLDFDTCQKRVLYLNLEMPPPWFMDRICSIKRVHEIDKLPKESFKAANLRGLNVLIDEKNGKVEPDFEPLIKACEEQGPFDVILWDPCYKILGDLDENKATDIAKLLRNIDEVGRITGAANVPIHHYAKGDAWAKKVGDRSSGSGVFLRDPDSYIEVTALNEETREARMDFRLRCGPPIESIGIRWENYRWKKDPNIDITPKKKRKTESENSESKVAEPRISGTGKIMVQILKQSPQGLTNTKWKEMAEMKGIKTDNFNYTVRRLKEEGWIKQENNLYFVTERADLLV